MLYNRFVNAYAPPEIQEKAPIVLAVHTNSGDRAIVAAYMEEKSLRKVAAKLLISHETVSNALNRFALSLTTAKPAKRISSLPAPPTD